MKNNFSNFIKIIFIIIGVSLIIGLVFFIITKNDYTASSNNKVSSSNDNNINLIADNLTQIFSYINNPSSTDNYACQILHQDIGFNIDENENFFAYYAPIIMDCIYQKNYPLLPLSSSKSYKIISKTELDTYANYFTSLKEFTPIKEIYTDEYISSLSLEDSLIYQNYLNDSYYIAYSVDENAPTNKISYSLERIIPENDYYIAYITATSTNVYSAELKITIENNHCRYGELIFY